MNQKIKILNSMITVLFCPTVIFAQGEGAGKLEDVVVTASGFEQQVKYAPASITVIKQEEIEKKAYRDITDVLKDVPGVVVTGGGASRDISIRGMGSAYTLMMIDGKRVDSRETRPNSDGPGVEQGWMPPVDTIERIEVIRGPMSGLYGSDAMGGVINIITKKTRDVWSGSIRSNITMQEDSDAGNTHQGSFHISGPLLKDILAMRINGLYSHRDEDKTVDAYNEQIMKSIGMVLSLTPNDQNIIDLEVNRSIQNRNGTVGKTISSVPRRRGGIPTNLESSYDRNQFSLTHRGYFDKWSTHSYIEHEESDNPGRSMKSINTILNTQNKISLGKHTLNIGGRYYKEKLKDKGNQLKTSTPISEMDRNSWALFAEDTWRIVEPFSLTSSIRFDKDENFGSHWTPKIYGVYTINPNWTLKGGISTGYKTPSLRAVNPNWGQATGGGRADGVILGNASLKPEKSVNSELSISWNNKLNTLNMGMTIYNSDFKDKITEFRVCQGVSGSANCPYMGYDYDFISERINVDKANMRGVEATLAWNITNSLKLATNYTYTQTKQKSGVFNGQPLNQMPKHMINMNLDWNYNEQLNYWTQLNYRSKTSDYLSRTSMAEAIPSYTFVDVGMNYKPKKNIQISAGVNNVLDKKVSNSVYGYTLDRRRYNLGIAYKF